MNPMITDIMRMRQMGVSPSAAIQQLSQRYPQFRQAMPYVQGKSPQQIDLTAQNMARSMGVDPLKVIQQFMGGKR